MARQSLLTRNQVKRLEPQVKPLPQLQLINGRLVSYTDNRDNYVIKGYMINDIIYSIVKMIADKARVAPWGLYTIKDEQSYKELQAVIRKKEFSLAHMGNLQRKALVPVQNAGKWSDLIKYPNVYQGFNDLTSDSISFKLITGNKFLWGNKLTGGANAGIPYEIEVLPAQWVDIISNGMFPARAMGYTIQTMIPGEIYLPETILHEKYFNPHFDINGNQLYGMSPIKAGLRRLQKSNLQLTAEAANWQNEGIKGIIAMKNQMGQVDGEEAQTQVEGLAETVRQEWSGSGNRGKMGVSGYDLSWIPIGLNAEEMALIESGLVDLRMMCNWFGGVPSQLLNDPARSTYNTVSEAEKALTTRCVMPELCATKDAYNRKFSQDWGLPKGVIVDFDLSVFSELQEDVGRIADWTSKMVYVVPDDQAELCGLAATGLPVMKEPWVMMGGNRVPLSDFQANAVDAALNNPNNPDNGNQNNP